MPQVAVPLPKQTLEAEQSARVSQQCGQLAGASLHPAAAARALVLPSCLSGNPLKTHIAILILCKGYGQLQLEKLPSC